MGGNALSLTSVRLTKENFTRLADHCVSKLRELYPANRVVAIQAYREKTDFGDLDVLVESTGFNPFDAAKVLDATEVVRNGPVTSIGVLVREDQPAVDGNIFQVDLVTISQEAFDFAEGYFGFNDLGNLIGRTAHAAGLAFKHDGLWYYYRDGDYLFRELLLTRDFDLALRFLGYNPERYHLGFDTLEDIFRYVAGSEFFNRDIFLLENRNAKSRIRDRKRKTYMSFLQWCEARPDLPAFIYPEEKSAWLPRIFAQFPQFLDEYRQTETDLAVQRAVKEKFNGEWVSQVTGLQGKELGMLMKHFKESFESIEEMRAFILEHSQSEIEVKVKRVQHDLNV